MRKHLLLTSGLLFFVVLLYVVYCLFFIRVEFLQHVSSLIGIQVQNQQQSNTRSSDQNNGSAPSVHNVVQPYDEHSWDAYQKPSAIELAQQLTPLQYYVTQEDGTETPFNNAYAGNHEKGIYVDIVSGEPLFSSEDKYESGTGWPSFVKPLVPENITLRSDTELLSVRTEVRSVHADSHLGHVFDDGPQDRGGKRYCMNSAAMRFIPYEQMQQDGYGYLLSGF